LIAYAAAAVRGERRGEAAMFIGAAIALAVIQAIVLASGSILVRRWEDTEFKELLIAIGLLAAAAEATWRIWRRPDLEPG